MVYEHEFKQTYYTLNQRPCSFEKAILSSRCACTKSQRLHIAEREGITCTSADIHPFCVTLLKQLCENAQFALKLKYSSQSLPHAKAMKVQCGGLLGLQAILQGESKDMQNVQDISTLILQAVATFGQFERLPYQEIIKFISVYQVRAKPTRR